MVLWKDKQNWEGLSEFPKNSERPQKNKIWNEKEVTIEIQRVIKYNYAQLFANIINNLEETDNLLNVYNLLRLNHKKIESIQR